MNSQQSLLATLMNRTFVVLNENESFDTTTSSEQVFQLRQNEPFAYKDARFVPTALVKYESSLQQLIEVLRGYEFALIHQGGQFIGYVSKDELLSQLANECEQTTAYLKTILATIDESCTVIDQDANVLYWTKGAEEIFSVQEKDIIGKPITDFFSEDRLEILNSLHNGTSVYQRQHVARNDVVVMINSNPVFLEEKIIGAVVSETDVTSLVRLNNELYLTSEKLFNLEEEVRKSSSTVSPFSYIRGNSPALKHTLEIVQKAAKTDANILIYGESGVGKELFAKAVHTIREDETAPFVAINCGAIPSGLFESEIFGYEKGAFSGANQKGKKGKVELASGGTLFLDEIGEMPLDMQVKILRLLQEKRFYPVGGTKEIEVDFRVVAATNRDLKELVQEGKFREDLYYRLNVVNFIVPPLRERIEDIIELSHYFLYEISIKYNRPIHGISQEVMQLLLQHRWPGNIRELKNVIERLVVFSENGEIKKEDLPLDFEQSMVQKAMPVQPTISPRISDESRTLSEQLEEYEREILVRELQRAEGNKQLCAKNLGVTRATLYNRMKKLNLNY